MRIDWSAFSPVNAITGGVLIGLATAVLILTLGKVAGISGIIGGLLQPKRKDTVWRVAFLLGLIVSPVSYSLFAKLPPLGIDSSIFALVVAGLLVGLGTRSASGCTSGHGVCGVSRGSPRSLLATAIFMAAGFLTVYVARHAV